MSHHGTTTSPAGAGSNDPHELRNTSILALVLSIVGSIVVFTIYSEATGAPETTCGWCGTNAFDESVRRLLYTEGSRGIGKRSHLVSIGLAPLFAFAVAILPGLRSPKRGHAGRNALMLLSAFILTTGIADGTKKLFDRERPGFLHGRAAFLEAADHPVERYLSFFSGDTAWAFVFVIGGLTIAALRGYRTPRWAVMVGLGIGVLGGLLRIMADMHWASDVMAGALAGAAVGAGIPYVLHARVREARRDPAR